LPARLFRPIAAPGTAPYAQVAVEPVTPLGPAEPVGDLIECHAAAGIQLRLLQNLRPFWAEVITSTVEFSGIRLSNAQPDRNSSAPATAG
jgi:hypothetical protein